MVKKSFLFLLLLLAVVISHPTFHTTYGNGSYADPELDSMLNDDIPQGWTQDAQREEALMKMRQIFGIPELVRRPGPRGILPQFMTELYNTVADRNGVKRRENPYNAKVVRSFIERDSSLSHYYLFNITKLNMNESVLGAELHLHLRKTPLKAMHPAVFSSPHYLIRVYQVLDQHQLDIPNSQKLLNVHRVGAKASGWQVLDVKQAVLSWMSGAPNLGLLVTVSDSIGGGVAVHFSRGSDHNRKQPILVLFNDENPVLHHDEYEDDIEEEDEEATLGFRRQKRKTTSLENGNFAGPLTSMEIYERAWKREKLARSRDEANAKFSTPHSTSELMKPQRRSRSTRKVFTITTPAPNTTSCARHKLHVNFKEFGWDDWIIAPESYEAYQCKGDCKFPLSQDLDPTNHAKVQSLVHLLKGSKYVDEPCCVPRKLNDIRFLYLDESNEVFLQHYKDMIVEKCGCN